MIVASIRMPPPRAVAKIFASVPGVALKATKARNEDQRGARDEPAGAADAFDDGGLGGAGAVVGLAHAADDEDLVVHRDAEEEGEDHDRHLDVDRLRGLDAPDRVGAEAVLEDEHDQAPRGGDREEVEQDGLQRQDAASGRRARAARR